MPADDNSSREKTSPLTYVYYYLVWPVFSEPIGFAWELFKRPSSQIGLAVFSGIVALGIYYLEDEWPIRYLVPGVADRYGLITEGTATRFSDGAVVKSRTDPFDPTKSILSSFETDCLDPSDSLRRLPRRPFPKLDPSILGRFSSSPADAVAAPSATGTPTRRDDARVSSKSPETLEQLRELLEANFPKENKKSPEQHRHDQEMSRRNLHSCATMVEETSTEGLGGLWRRYPGRLLAILIDRATENINPKPVYGKDPAGRNSMIRHISRVFFSGALLVYLVFLITLTASVIFAIRGITSASLIISRALWPPLTSPWSVNTTKGKSLTPILAVISDTHVTSQGVMPYEINEGYVNWPGGAKNLQTGERLAVILHQIRNLSPRPAALALTGDLVDLGFPAEWAEFESRFKSSLFAGEGQPWDRPIAVVPGNHDISINPGCDPDHFLEKRTRRIEACKIALSAITGRSYPEKWRDAYPQLTELGQTINQDFPIAVIGLDSLRYKSRQILSNAVGYIGRTQLRTLSLILSQRSGPIVVLIHHHVSRPKGSIGMVDRLHGPFKIAIDGDLLLRILCGYSAKEPRNVVLVIHGHQHEEFFQVYVSRSGHQVHIYGHPSSTMGAEKNGILDGEARYALVCLNDACEWVVETVSIRG